MKYYIDRKRLGIAEIFSDMHKIFSPSNDMTPEETVELMCQQSRRTRSRIAAAVNHGVRKMTSSPGADVDEYLNDDVRDIADTPVNADTLGSLLPFMKWLAELHRLNSLDVERSQYSLNDAADNMDRDAGEYLKNCSQNMMWQNITLLQEEGGLLMNTQERFWGKTGLFFPDVRTEFEGAFPLVGMLFCIEGEHSGQGFQFSFLLNVEFGTDDMELRALQNRNWVRITFRCGKPEMRCSLYDYGGFLGRMGERGHGFIDDWCRELLSKEQTIGVYGMSPGERELLPMARVFRIIYQMSDIEGAGHSGGTHSVRMSGKAAEAIGNRFNYASLGARLDECGMKELRADLDEIVEAWSCDDPENAADAMWSFARRLRSLERSDRVRELYGGIVGCMKEATAGYADVSRLYGGLDDACEKIRLLLEPKLTENGFTGSYPHYRRRRGKKGEYISLINHNLNQRTVNGMMIYYFAMSAAVKPLSHTGKRKERSWFAAGIPFDLTTAEDCATVSDGRTKYAMLGGLYDGESAEVYVSVFDGISDEPAPSDTADSLLRSLDVALGEFRGRAMPRRYKKKRRRVGISVKNETTLNGVFMKFLPLGMYISALLMGAYVVCDRFFGVSVPGIPDPTSALLVSLLTGMLTALGCSALRLHRLGRHIWRH